MSRVEFKMEDGQEVEALTLLGLRDRLIEMVQENESKGWSVRNHTPVVLSAQQGLTPSGRKRAPHYYPIRFGLSSLRGLIGQTEEKDIIGFTVLESGPVIESASKIKRR